MTQTNKPSKKTPKPCPRCQSAAGQGNGGSQCQCKKGKQAAAAPCDLPARSSAEKTDATTSGCGCKH